MNEIQEATRFLKTKFRVQPRIAVVLGSGLGPFADELEDAVSVSFSDIPHFPKSTVEGHSGKLVCGNLRTANGTLVPVLAQQGRVHYYEGHDLSAVTFPVRVMALLGISTVVMTNAAGGVNPSFREGDIMFITDHMNFTGLNPLRGPNMKDLGTRFIDMTEAYDRSHLSVLRQAAERSDVEAREGVYLWFTGPTYETPAEVRAARILGADAVGMSTVPEVIAARHAGIKVAGLSCITNLGAGLTANKLTHEDVMKAAGKAVDKIFRILRQAIPELK